MLVADALDERERSRDGDLGSAVGEAPEEAELVDEAQLAGR
jgi:hypothetical protein